MRPQGQGQRRRGRGNGDTYALKIEAEEARSTKPALQGIWVLPRLYSCRPATTDDQALWPQQRPKHISAAVWHTQAQALKYLYKRAWAHGGHL